jgi:hypothetical protein
MIIVHKIRGNFYLVDMTRNTHTHMVKVSKAVAMMALSRG